MHGATRIRTTHPDRGGIWAKMMLALAAGVALAVVVWILFLPRIVAATVRSKTGFNVQVDSLSVNPFTAKVSIAGLVLKNPTDWPAADFVDLREFRANADLLSLFGERLVADEVVVDVVQVSLVKNRDGVLNAIAFKNGFTGEKPPAGKAKPAKQFLIKRLSLKFGKLVYADHSKGSKPDVKEFNVNLTRELRDVDSVAKIIDPFRGTLVMGVLTDTLKSLFTDSPDLLKSLLSPIQDAGKATGEALKGLLQSLEKKKS